MTENYIYLPEVIIDTHLHARGLDHSYKTTPQQVLKEARDHGISISIIMPNPKPFINSYERLLEYIRIVEFERKALGIDNEQYFYFAITDNNLSECEKSLDHPLVVGLKEYSKLPTGDIFTTATDGVSHRKITEIGMRMTARKRKIYAKHCGNPYIIQRNGGNDTIEAEFYDVDEIIGIQRNIPDAIVLICHGSCRRTADAVIRAQKNGQRTVLEICAHYLMFSSDKTNWNPNIDPVFYHCFNNLRGEEDRQYLISLLSQEDIEIVIGSDSACHTRDEKLAQHLGGIPSNQEFVATMATLAVQHKIPDHQIARLISSNPGRLFNIPVSKKMKKYRLEKRIDDIQYNNGKVLNPWNELELLFPVEIPG